MAPLPNLYKISITFETHSEDDRDPNTVLHVFIKNRRSDTQWADNDSDYISNFLAWRTNVGDGTPDNPGADPNDRNPLLAYGENLGAGETFGNGSTFTFDLPLRPTPIPCSEILLPVVNIHILPEGNDTWVFEYTVNLYFADPTNATDPNHIYDFSFSSSTNGETGIILSQDNRNYVGIGTENKWGQDLLIPPPDTASVLTKIQLDFSTTSGVKASGTQLNVYIANRISANESQVMAQAENLWPGEAFSTPSSSPSSPAVAKWIWLTAALHTLASDSIRLKDIVLPIVTISLGPQADPLQSMWGFDFRVRYFFSDETVTYGEAYVFDSTTSGIVMDLSEARFTCIHLGDSFPSIVHPAAALTLTAPPLATKSIAWSFLKQKLDEFINDRQGVDPQSPAPAIFKLRLHNSGAFGATLPANYYDLQTIDAGPPLPNTPVAADFVEGVKWDHDPKDLGTSTGLFDLLGIYFNDIDSSNISVTVDPTNPTPLAVVITFSPTAAPQFYEHVKGQADASAYIMESFSISLRLTLNLDQATHSRIDLMSWVYDLNNNLLEMGAGPTSTGVTGTFLGKTVSFPGQKLADVQDELLESVLDVRLDLLGASSPGGSIQKGIRQTIFKTLSNVDPITHVSVLDSLNSLVNAWLVGGTVVSQDHGVIPVIPNVPPGNTCKVQSVGLDATGENIEISYYPPQYSFEWPSQVANWPAANDLDPGPLANIDHIIVLMMENRSFDQMLGYLSLPPGEKGGSGLTTVEGLKGDEKNLLVDGTSCPSQPAGPGETIFAPDPPHSFEPVHRAINGGLMDGFAQSYAFENGMHVGPNIMKYYTADHVPTYDALVRDFATCQRWFASHPGSTFPNRFYALTGRLNIDEYGIWELNNSNPKKAVFTPTIFDYLSNANVSWKYFERSYSFLRFFANYTFDNEHIVSFDDPGLGFMEVLATGNLPSVTYIDPHFVELPPNADCDGPPADIQQGQRFIQQVIDAVVTSPTWNKTMLIVTYDEHGGFYDHVAPPPAAQVAPGLPDTYGVRIPTFVISPWVTGGRLFGNDAAGQTPSAWYDHTSVLKTIQKRFLYANPQYMGPRYAAANDLSSLMNATVRSDALLPFIPYNLLFNVSQMSLEVEGGAATAGTALWQAQPDNSSNAQQFSFEDAGSGYYYIRTHCGNLYLTADLSAPGGPATVAIKQDVKFATGGGANPDSQLWSFAWFPTQANSGVQIVTIHNKAVPGTTLHPAAQTTAPGAAVVLEAVTGGSIGLTGNTTYVWEITSPLIPNKSGIAGPIPPPAAVGVVPSSLAFPAQQINARSNQQTVTVAQPPVPGNMPLAITSIALLDPTGAASADFVCVPPPGSPPPSGSIEIQNGQLVVTVWFIPAAAGTRNATLQIGHNQPGSPLVVQLSGVGDPKPLPLLSFSPGSLEFDTTQITNHTVTLKNTGAAPLTIISITIDDPNYYMTNTCNIGPAGGTLQPGQQCTVNVTCRFIGPGKTSQMVITHDAVGGPAVVELNATSKGGGPGQ